jgi:hypothetical protein
MSYVRWGSDGSNVYMIADCSGGWWCVGCDMEGKRSATRTGMLKHLQAHRDAGDIVPEYVFDRLKHELQEDGETEFRI